MTYSDNRRRELEFEEANNVYLTISSMNGVMKSSRKGSEVLVMRVPLKFCKELARLKFFIFFTHLPQYIFRSSNSLKNYIKT